MSSKKKPQTPKDQVIPEESIEQPETQESPPQPEDTQPPDEPLMLQRLMGKSHAQLVADVEEIKGILHELCLQVADLQAMMEKKYTPRANGKTKIRDTKTGEIYPSKNNCYQTLLKAGELKDLVDKGVFGALPAKNNFGWFALNRAYPDRFEEVHNEDKEENTESNEQS